MNTVPQSDNPIFKAKAKSLYPRLLLSIKNINCTAPFAELCNVQKELLETCFSRDIVLFGSNAVLCTNALLLSPSGLTPVLSPPAEVSSADWSTWELPCLFKNSRAQTPNYEYAKQQGREAHLFHDSARSQTFFSQQQEDRSFTLKAELMPRCQEATIQIKNTAQHSPTHFTRTQRNNAQEFTRHLQLPGVAPRCLRWHPQQAIRAHT